MPHVTDSELRFILRHQNGTFILTKYPKGWESIVFNLTRSQEYDGVFYEVTQDLGFYCNGGGKEYIDADYESNGIDATGVLEIQYKCDGGFETIFDGKLNYAVYSRDADPVSELLTKIEIETNDITQQILNRLDVKIDLTSNTALDGGTLTSKTYNNYSINLHSQPIRQASLLKEPTSIQYNDTFNLTNGLVRTIFIADPHPMIKNELQTTTSNGDTIDVVNGGFPGASNAIEFHTANDPLVSYPVTYTLRYRIKGSSIKDNDATGQTRTCSGASFLLFYGASKASASFINLGQFSAGYTTSSTSFTVSGVFDFNSSTTFTMNSGDKIWFNSNFGNYVITTGPGSFNITIEYNFEIVELELYVDSTQPDSTASGSAIFEAYSHMAESITGQLTGAFESNFYGRKNSSPVAYSANGCGSFKAITNGVGIRGYTDRPIATSFNDLFLSSKAVDNVGMGIETVSGISKIRVEDLSYFYDTSEIVFSAIGIRDLKMSIDLIRIYNEAEFGFNKWQVEELGGLDSINTKHEYELEVINHKNKLSQISPYLADGYIIETTRRKNSIDYSTEDTEEDNDMFFICLSRSVDGGGNPDELDTPETNQDITTSSGIENVDKRYNLWISPERNRLRWNNVLSSAMIKNVGGVVNFRFGEANLGAVVEWDAIGCDGDYSGVSLNKNASVAWDDANARQTALWIPEVYEWGNYPVSYSEYKNIKDNLYKLISFDDGTTRRFGWILELNYDLRRKLGNFKVLRANI